MLFDWKNIAELYAKSYESVASKNEVELTRQQRKVMPIARGKILWVHPTILEIARAGKVAENLENYLLTVDNLVTSGDKFGKE